MSVVREVGSLKGRGRREETGEESESVGLKERKAQTWQTILITESGRRTGKRKWDGSSRMQTDPPSCNQARIVKILMLETCECSSIHLFIRLLAACWANKSLLALCREQKDLPFPSTIGPRKMEVVV